MTRFFATIALILFASTAITASASASCASSRNWMNAIYADHPQELAVIAAMYDQCEAARVTFGVKNAAFTTAFGMVRLYLAFDGTEDRHVQALAHEICSRNTLDLSLPVTLVSEREWSKMNAIDQVHAMEKRGLIYCDGAEVGYAFLQ